MFLGAELNKPSMHIWSLTLVQANRFAYIKFRRRRSISISVSKMYMGYKTEGEMTVF